MNKYAAEWFELEFVLGSAVKREQNVDLRKDVDWSELEQVTFGAAICAGCVLMEKAGLKGSNQHIKVLFELRNAYVHNNCDISLNKNQNAQQVAIDYLTNNEFKNSPVKIDNPFYELQDTKVIFNRGIYIAIRKCLL